MSAASSDWDLINSMLGFIPPSVALGTDEASLLTFADANPSPRPEAKRDGRGSYRLPDPTDGFKEKSWTRATTLAKTISDEFALTKWKIEMVAVGMSRRPDLVQKVARVDTTADHDKKGRVADLDKRRIITHACDQAAEEAGAGLRAKMGTALHTLTEHHDLGRGKLGPKLCANGLRHAAQPK